MELRSHLLTYSNVDSTYSRLHQPTIRHDMRMDKHPFQKPSRGSQRLHRDHKVNISIFVESERPLTGEKGKIGKVDCPRELTTGGKQHSPLSKREPKEATKYKSANLSRAGCEPGNREPQNTAKPGDRELLVRQSSALRHYQEKIRRAFTGILHGAALVDRLNGNCVCCL